jgi:hypothetical protein
MPWREQLIIAAVSVLTAAVTTAIIRFVVEQGL